MARCCDCGKDYMKNRACEHCGEIYCETHWPLHMSLEKSNEKLAREIARVWRHEHPLVA